MKRKIGIIGYGALGQQIENFILEEHGKGLVEIYYFDDVLYQKGNDSSFRFNDFDNNKFKNLDFYIGLGYNHLGLRKEICDQLICNQFHLPSFIHKTSYVNSTAKIGSGVFIYPMCNIDQLVQIENGVIINNSVTISHNAVIQVCSFIAPGVTLAGNVDIGKYSFIGTGSVIANNVKVGDKVRVGIGSNITKDIQDNLSVIGNPYRILKKSFRL